MTPASRRGGRRCCRRRGGPSFSECGRPRLISVRPEGNKVRIAYATLAKKVDVRKLKAQMWRDVERRLPRTPAAVVNLRRAAAAVRCHDALLLHLPEFHNMQRDSAGAKNHERAAQPRCRRRGR